MPNALSTFMGGCPRKGRGAPIVIGTPLLRWLSDLSPSGLLGDADHAAVGTGITAAAALHLTLFVLVEFTHVVSPSNHGRNCPPDES